MLKREYFDDLVTHLLLSLLTPTGFILIFIVIVLLMEQSRCFKPCRLFQGRQWGEMAPEVKQHYQQIAEEGRQKYDQVIQL